jgi:large subunit ribosomal protein L35
MPKVKTNSAAKKRFRFTASGKIKRKQAFKNHILTKKSKKRKRHLTGTVVISDANLDKVRALMGVNH